MSRPKLIPDSDVQNAILYLLDCEGEKAVSFSRVARTTGLAPATLVQRFGSLDGMLKAALNSGWDAADATLTAACTASLDQKGALQLLKSLPEVNSLLAASQRDEALRQRAAHWRGAVEAALTMRLGSKSKQGQKAALLFALWQGQLIWQNSGGKSLKLKEVLKQLL
jgi:AcrR family transcriptional regulator